MKKILIILALLFLMGCTLQGKATTSPPEKPYLTFPGSLYVTVEVADDINAWTRGLMGRENLPENHGMLFIFPDEREATMWMKDTKIPLDILFFNKEFEIVDFKENFKPCTENCERDIYTAKQKIQYALEVNAGFVQKNKIEIGQKATLTRP